MCVKGESADKPDYKDKLFKGDDPENRNEREEVIAQIV